MRPALVAFSLALAACPQNGTHPLGEPLDQLAGFAGVPTMQPGSDCMLCHVAGGDASDRIWTAAGTIFSKPTACQSYNPYDGGGCGGGLEGVQVLLTDANQQQLTLTTNQAGNFYTDQPLATLTSIMIQKGTHRMVMNLEGVGGGGNLTLSSLGVDGTGAGPQVSCNACHAVAATSVPFGSYSSPGSLFIPED
jgi:hypothetical protein